MTTLHGYWDETAGNVDPVLLRVVHRIRCLGNQDPDRNRLLAELDGAITGTRVDAALSRHRALHIVDRVLRQSLPRLLRAVPQGGDTVRVAADTLERLDPVQDAATAGRAVGVLFRLDTPSLGSSRRAMRAAWESARHAKRALVAEGRLYQLGTAALYACEALILLSPLNDVALGAVAADPGLHLAVAIIRETAELSDCAICGRRGGHGEDWEATEEERLAHYAQGCLE